VSRKRANTLGKVDREWRRDDKRRRKVERKEARAMAKAEGLDYERHDPRQVIMPTRRMPPQ
jgi:hypothetical protein